MGTQRTGEADAMITLAENRYGKSRVRLVKVKRHPDGHDEEHGVLVGTDFIGRVHGRVWQRVDRFLAGSQPAGLRCTSHAFRKDLGASPHTRKAASYYICAIERRMP